MKARALGSLALVLVPTSAWASRWPSQDLFTDALTGDYSPALHSFVLLTLLSFIPLMVIAMTSFTRIIIVLSMLRTALGLQQTPPNSVLLTLALFMTLFTMNPVFQVAKRDALEPYLAHTITAGEAATRGFEPFKLFMIHQTRQDDLLSVMRMAGLPPPAGMDDIGALQLVPAFMLSELRTAFQIGFVIFLPFLLIDLIVSAILMALGMIMLPPTTISLPLKILLFLLINGWSLLAQSLLAGYRN